ncbi:MAG: DUF192 domain-containing protein [Candidatus Magasanikbacteria bacterium]
MKFRFKYLFVAVFLVSAVFLYFTYDDFDTARIKLGGEQLRVLVAETRYQKYKGLGGRRGLDEYDGMLFKYFPPRKVGIVMRDMKFPIDIVWLNDGKVVDIAPNVQPQPDTTEEKLKVYRPRKKANLVVELPAGWSKKHSLEIGNKIKILKQ